MRVALILFILLLSLVLEAKECSFKKYENSYAKKFAISQSNEQFKIEISGEMPLYLYKDRKIDCGKGIYLKYPVKRAAIFSTTYIGFINRLKSLSNISFVSTGKYIYCNTARKRLRSGIIKELGYPPRSELILKYRPSVILDFPPVGTMPSYILPTRQSEIPVIFIKEHYEKHPLARAEWIKVFGTLVGKKSSADKLFEKIRQNYLKISEQVKVSKKKSPVALVGKLYHGSWHAPSKSSYLVAFLKDLDVHYLFSSKKEGRLLLSFEEVLKASSKASFWLPQALWQKTQQAYGESNKYKLFSKQLKSNIYSNSLHLGKNGGTDYWESGAAYPDRILSDLAKIFYPDIIKADQFYYYKKLK